MDRRKHCTPEKRELKIEYEKSYSENRKLLDCSNKMIINALRYEAKVQSCGRKRILSPLILKHLHQTTKSYPFMPATELRKRVECVGKSANYSSQATRQQS